MAEKQEASGRRGSGSGSPSPERPRFRIGVWWVVLAVGLLVVNVVAGSLTMRGETRMRVPYSPFFLDQVDAGHVEEITSKGTAIQGTFSEPQRYGDSEPASGVRDRDSGVRRHRLALAAARAEERRRQRRATRYWVALVAEPAALVRPDDPLRRVAVTG